MEGKSQRISQVKDDIIEVTYKGKKIVINVTEELMIDDNTINRQLTQLPSNYAFLCLLRDEAIHKRDIMEAKMNQVYSEVWLYYKNADSRSTNDTASKRADSNQKYLSIQKKYLKALDKANRLSSICRAYESRERLIQTLASNLRKQQ